MVEIKHIYFDDMKHQNYFSSSKYNSYLFYSTCTKNSHMIFRYRYSLDECGLLNMHLTKRIDDCSIGVLTNILPLLVVYLSIFWFHNVCYYHPGCNDICHFRIYSCLSIGLILIQPFEVSNLFLIIRLIHLKDYD